MMHYQRDFSRNFLKGWKIQPMMLKLALYLPLSQQVYFNMGLGGTVQLDTEAKGSTVFRI